MKRIFFGIVLVISFLFLAEAFAYDVYTDPIPSGPLLMAGADKSNAITNRKSCSDDCQAQNRRCEDSCTINNKKCQEACEHDENCINACGRTYSSCKNSCDLEFQKCIKTCDPTPINRSQVTW